ncbi:MAG: serine/threonine protein kinase [Planctomycetales bacterium]|nr:serine/threonine protein kinase [Planctomycetales bacterium]
MQEPASLLNPARADDALPAGEGRKRGPMKFAYASGTRPLEGYTIKRGVGAGGFGEVYYATSDAGKEVALKRIQRNLDVELRGVSQCLNLKHANLVALYDIRYDDDEQAWVVMEYVSGDSLQETIERFPQGMPSAEADRWFHGILHGVAYLHDHGIVHRDLKPGNIFLDQGVVKIGDYGLAKFISCSRRSGQTESVGTFHYMAPEIGLGRYGKEIDIYALGILLFEMLSGRVPFEGESSQEIIMKHLTAQPDLSRLPPRYRAVVARALAKDPAARFQSVHEMIAALNLATPNPSLPRDETASPLHRAQHLHAAAHQSPPPLGQAGDRAYQLKTPNGATYALTTAPRRQEPLAAFLRARGAAFRNWWKAHPPVSRVVMVALLVVFGVPNLPVIAPTMFTAGVVYAVYYLLWSVLTGAFSVGPPAVPRAANAYGRSDARQQAPSPVTPAPVMAQVVPAPAAPARKPPRVVTRRQLEDTLRDSMQQKTRMQLGAEVTGSMIMSALVLLVASLLGAALFTKGVSGDARAFTKVFTWIFTTGLCGSWLLLLFGKSWESASDDPALRRFWLLLAGGALGCVAYGLSELIMLDPVYLIGHWHQIKRNSFAGGVPAFYDPAGAPQLLAFVGYFGGVFATVRWWLRTDPLRPQRLSILSTAVALGVGWLWSFFVLPIPSGFIAVGAIAIGSQMSATWIPNRIRDRTKDYLLSEQQA